MDRVKVENKESVYEMLGEARAIHYAMRHHALTYEQAKVKTQPILKLINDRLRAKAKEFGRIPRKITFHDLARNI